MSIFDFANPSETLKNAVRICQDDEIVKECQAVEGSRELMCLAKLEVKHQLGKSFVECTRAEGHTGNSSLFMPLKHHGHWVEDRCLRRWEGPNLTEEERQKVFETGFRGMLAKVRRML